jgi:putative Ca2+/H+ antiporter (TMEM165/GDT1 family)
MNKAIAAITAIAIATFAALMLTGCACKGVPAQLSKNAETWDKNADFLIEKVKAGELPSIEWAESQKVTAAKNKKLAEANNE